MTSGDVGKDVHDRDDNVRTNPDNEILSVRMYVKWARSHVLQNLKDLESNSSLTWKGVKLVIFASSQARICG